LSENTLSKHDHVLIGFFSSLQAAAMQHMGKLANPVTGEVERDMVAAQSTIDILEMLKAKCRTDTPEELLRFMDTAVMELQMNFLDEKKKDEQQEKGDDEESSGAGEETPEAGEDETEKEAGD
jgi:hypothetical protein